MRFKVVTVLCCGVALLSAAKGYSDITGTTTDYSAATVATTTTAATATPATTENYAALVQSLSASVTSMNALLSQVVTCNNKKQFYVNGVCESADSGSGVGRWVLMGEGCSTMGGGSNKGKEGCDTKVIQGGPCNKLEAVCYGAVTGVSQCRGANDSSGQKTASYKCM